MKKHLKQGLLSLFLFCAAVEGGSAQTQVVDLSTGVDDATSTRMAVGTTDDTWVVQVPGGSSYISPKTTTGAPAGYSPYSGLDPAVRMISPYYNSSYDLTNSALTGTYTYKMTFYYNYSSCASVSSASIHFNSIGADNSVTNISVNGTTHILGYGFSPFGSNVNITLATSEIIAGTNTVLVTVSNGSDFTGFVANGTLSINYAPFPLTASFTGNSTYCDGSTITVDATSSSGPISYHQWSIQQCNSHGVPVFGAPNWSSPALTGAPNIAYNVPSAAYAGPALTCGNYYSVVLRVYSACGVSSSTFKVIYINCLPTVSTNGSTPTICAGDVGSLNTIITNYNSAHSYTLTWYYIGGYFHGYPLVSTVYSGIPASVNVSPGNTTTYYGSVTDNTTGCSTNFTYVVNVVQNDPSFSISTNTSNLSYYTITAQANDVNANLVSGFNYSLVVEELDGSGAAYYSASGSGYWSDFPTHVFPGFVSMGTGTFTQNSSSTPGQFLYNHNYRITRYTSNDYCSWKQSSVTINSVRSIGAPPVFTITPDNESSYVTELPAGVLPVKETTMDVNIYPNPNNGVFTIETGNASKTTVEIYDALGKKVKGFEQEGGTSTVDLSGYPKGIYMVKMVSDGKLSSKKIILE